MGLSFFDVTANDVTIQSLAGLPSINIDNFLAAIHSRYDSIPHTYTLGGNTLILYDGNRDTTLTPVNAATPYEITAVLETHTGDEYLKITAPIYVSVPLGGYGTYTSYGRVIFWRQVIRDDTTITVNMGTEPSDASLKTTVELDNAHPARDLVISNLTPLVISTLGGYGTIVEPGFSESAARQMLKDEIAGYINVRRYPVYSPKSGDPDHPLTTPVGFLLVAAGVLSILLNRRDSSVADFAPDDFLGSNQLALAVGRAEVDSLIHEAIVKQFPDLESGGQEISTPQGDATLKSVNATPSDAGDHDQTVGHLWVTGEAEVHIDCWPDPDVSFEGPVFIDAHREDTDQGCELVIEPRAGEFDVDESCCDVLLDLLIPIVGWIVLAIVEHTIDEVGGELATQIAGSQGQVIKPIPPVVNGIAEMTGCLTGLTITSQGFVFPGEVTIRRLGTSFQDRQAAGRTPRPDSP